MERHSSSGVVWVALRLLLIHTWPVGSSRLFLSEGLLITDLSVPVTGPPKYAELRINLAQAVQAIGTGE